MLHCILQVTPKDTFGTLTFMEILNDGVDRPDDYSNRLNRRYKEPSGEVVTTKKFWNGTKDYIVSCHRRLTPFRLEFIYE